MKKVVLVDDDEDVLDILSFIFLEKGWEVYKYMSPPSLNLLRSTKPDLVLLDVWLPRTAGHDLCKQIKADPELKRISVYLVSAVSELKDIAQTSGADGFIEKPFELTSIEALRDSHQVLEE